MNPPIRNWKKEDADDEQNHYTYEKPNFGEKDDKKQKTKIYTDDSAVVELLEKIENDEFQNYSLSEFLDAYKKIEKFLLQELKIKDKDNKSWYFESARNSMTKMYKACACKDGLFTIEEVVWKRMLKRLWGVYLIEVQQHDELYKKSDGKSVQVWNEFKDVTELHFETLKSVFSNIYRDLAPLSSDLKFENSLRALTA